jgi:ATP-dependent DNA helicase RecG
MPSALETLVKILKLEREQGCENRAVIGGLAAYSDTWKQQAQAQARRPEHKVLADELCDLLLDYEHLDSQIERMKQIEYMIDRITGRAPMPPAYQERIEAEQAVNLAPSTPQKQSLPPREQKEHKENKEHREGKERRDHKEQKEQHREHAAAQNKRRSKSSDEDDDDDGAEMSGYNDKSRAPESYGYDNYQPIAAKEMDIPTMPSLARPPRKARPNLSLDETRSRLDKLEFPVTEIKGIGQSLADDLAKLDIHTIKQMLWYLPRRHDDYTRLKTIKHLQAEEVATVIGTVTHTEVRAGKNNRKDFHMVVEDGTGKLQVTFFGQHFLIRSIRKNEQIVLSGKVGIWGNRLQMNSPEWESVDSENLHTIGIVPVYRLTEGIKPRMMRRLMKKAVEQFVETIPDHIPEAVLERCELGDLGWTLENLHFPLGHDHLVHAHRRYLFDQLLVLQLGILGKRRDWQAVKGQALHVDDGWMDDFIANVFPYELTGAQRQALWEIRRDMASDTPMNRLLQGDVGAGKTAVAVATMGMALYNRKQAAIMAPTSILAEQHYRGISRAFENMPGDFRPVIALLTSALSNSERESVYRGIADGSIDLVIGTHALIQSGVEFKDLAVAIVDEQHRFGVEQRAALRGKGTNPHLLVMTATPIPRTLALTMFADLDLSILGEKPPGRQKIDTRIVDPVSRERAFNFIEVHLQDGRQAFVIHPLVEASDKIEARSAVEAFQELKKVFYKYRVCLLHGRMSPSEKDEIMGAFARHEYDVMVTTSVAEVGVDVPNANIILIEGANRFGLAQLHQFRGRVGRGEHKSFCLLIPDSANTESDQRLRVMVDTDDGFVLAEMDWKMRGAGDLLGSVQSGGNVLELAEEITPELVMLAQQEARTIYAEDPYLSQEQHLLLAEKVAARMNQNAGGGDVS